jgi:hypothetical protein
MPQVYWVCNQPGDQWVCLPDVTPEQLQVARLTVRCMTGDLDAEVRELFCEGRKPRKRDDMMPNPMFFNPLTASRVYPTNDSVFTSPGSNGSSVLRQTENFFLPLSH